MAAQQIPALANNVEDMEMEQQDNEHHMDGQPEQEERANKRVLVNSEDMEAKKSKIELTEFIKYGKLAPELRHPILSYADYKTLKEYAQCSKVCKKEFERFELPYRVEFQEVGDVIDVTMTYKGSEKVKSKWFAIYDDRREMEDMLQYVKKCFNCSEYSPVELVINMKHWPETILKDSPIGKSQEWHVTLNQSMYDKFMDLMEKLECENEDKYVVFLKKLYLKDCDEQKERVVLGPQFYENEFIGKLERLKISTNIDITHDIFVRTKFEDLELTNWCNMAAIQDKVSMAMGDREEEITIVLSPDNDQTFDIAKLFPYKFFDVRYSKRYPEIFRVDDFVAGTTHSEGKKLSLIFFCDFEEAIYDFDDDDDEDTVEDTVDKNDNNSQEIEYITISDDDDDENKKNTNTEKVDKSIVDNKNVEVITLSDDEDEGENSKKDKKDADKINYIVID